MAYPERVSCLFCKWDDDPSHFVSPRVVLCSHHACGHYNYGLVEALDRYVTGMIAKTRENIGNDVSQNSQTLLVDLLKMLHIAKDRRTPEGIS